MTLDTLHGYGFVIPFTAFLNDKAEAHMQFSLDSWVHDNEDLYQKSLREDLAFSDFEYLALRKKFFLDTESNEEEDRNEWDELSVRLSDIMEYEYARFDVLLGSLFDKMGLLLDEAADYAGVGFISNPSEGGMMISGPNTDIEGSVFIYINRTLRFASTPDESADESFAPTDEEREALARFIKDFSLDVMPSTITWEPAV